MKKAIITPSIATGIVSEIRVGTLVSSKNDYLKYPLVVCVHVMERGAYGDISFCTVNTGNGTFVEARGARFVEMSGVLPFKYQHCQASEVLEYYKEWSGLLYQPQPLS